MPTPVQSPCPPTPPAVADAAGDALTSQGVAHEAARDLDVTRDDSARNRRLALEYAEQLADVVRSEDWLRETMRAYGRYLHQYGIRPEHIVICVHESMEHPRLRGYANHGRLVERAIGWTIEGYYAERTAQSS